MRVHGVYVVPSSSNLILDGWFLPLARSPFLRSESKLLFIHRALRRVLVQLYLGSQLFRFRFFYRRADRTDT